MQGIGSTTTGSLRYRPEIDGLRAVAVVPVVFFHAGFNLFAGGFVGVDVFFVISGYLITLIILGEMAEGRFSLWDFYERRARRILPALTLVVGASILAAWVWVIPSGMDQFAKSVLAVCFFVSNFFFWRESDYFDQGSDFEPLLHTWSLSVEEQFYLLFPLLLLFLWKGGRRRIGAVLTGIFAASLALAEWGAHAAPEANFFLLPSRAWELALGALLALQFGRGRISVDPRLSQLISGLGLAMIAFAVFAFDETTPFPGLYALLPTVGAALIIAFASPANLVGRLLGSRLPVAIGLVSYSAYLWHQPIFAFSRYIRGGELPTADLLLLTALTFALAYLTWRLVETPFRRREKVGRPALVATAGATGTAFIAFCLVAIATGSFTTIRFNDTQEALLHSASRSDLRKGCHARKDEPRRAEQACAYYNPDPSWAVVGNSHGVELAYAIAENLRSTGDGVKHLTVSSCRPYLIDPNEPGCARWTADALDYVLREDGIRNVVLSYRTNGLAPHDDAPWKPVVDTNLRQLAESYFSIARKLADSGKRVFVVLQAPVIERHIEHYVRDLDADDGVDFVFGVDRKRWDRSIEPIRDELDDLPPNVAVIDPAQLFCNPQACASIMSAKALYYDDSHMSLAGAKLVADEILRRAARTAWVQKAI